MKINDEVIAVILALITVSSIFALTVSFPRQREPFLAIGLLNEHCKIDYYPKYAVAGQPIRLCIFLANHLGEPALLKVVAKIGNSSMLPTNTAPLNTTPIYSFTVLLPDEANITKLVDVGINVTGRAALVFELWKYSIENHTWVYTGKWVHLYIRVIGGWSLGLEDTGGTCRGGG